MPSAETTGSKVRRAPITGATEGIPWEKAYLQKHWPVAVLALSIKSGNGKPGSHRNVKWGGRVRFDLRRSRKMGPRLKDISKASENRWNQPGGLVRTKLLEPLEVGMRTIVYEVVIS